MSVTVIGPSSDCGLNTPMQPSYSRRTNSASSIAQLGSYWNELFCLVSGRPETRQKSSFQYEPSCAIEEAEFVLREYDGCIGVFSPQSDDGPITVTDIETRSLREADREIVKNGIAVADREELLSLLEDFGS